MANIKSNNHRKIDCRIIDDIYMDFMLSKDEVYANNLADNCLSAKLQFNNENTKHVVSNISWYDAKTSDEILDNIGYTGVDNGFISYERDRIGNDEFLDIYTNSKFDLSTFGDKFFVSEVSGNTQMLQYPIEKHDDCVSLKGGFYQGFFKIEGSNYQTLPHRIYDEWNFNITLRVKDYDVPSNTLNNRHPNNKGMFFYIGTRAENKFWELYKHDDTTNALKSDESSDYSIDYDMIDAEVIKHQYHEDIPNPSNRDDQYGNFCNCNDYFEEGFDPYGDMFETTKESCSIGNNSINSSAINTLTDLRKYDYSEFNSCGLGNSTTSNRKDSCTTGYFDDGYTGEGTTTTCDCPVNDLAIDDEYILPQMSLENIQLIDSKGFNIGEKGFYEIETDNKFIIFHRGKGGFNKDTWKNEYKFVLTGKTDSPTINYYPYLNRTSTGYTTETIDKLIKEHSYAYDIFNDIKDNAFGVKINDDGSITYRCLIFDCDSENTYKVEEETSMPGIVSTDVWNNIHIKMVRTPSLAKTMCDDQYKQGKMKVYIYVNGCLKIVSKELPELMLRPLNDGAERQEGVPYNISIGGGTQGLAERIYLDYYDVTDYLLPLEKNFGGTFIGDIKDFAFYDCQLPYSTISQLGKHF